MEQLLVEREEFVEAISSLPLFMFEVTVKKPTTWSVLVSVLDTPGGEYFGHDPYTDLRRTALSSDRYLLLYDVTHILPDRDAIAFSQIAAHVRYLAGRYRAVGKRSLAIGLTKIDAVQERRLHSLVEELKSEAPIFSLTTIERTHARWAAALAASSDIRPISFDDLFPDYRFFPITSIGLDPSQPFREPRGLIEPLVWLLHDAGLLRLGK
ncbi:MAG: hypothetical protein ACKV2U_27855 [Bryobacteraceae bacterium]